MDLLKAVDVGRSTYAEEAVQACSLLGHWIYKEEAEAAIASVLAERPDDGPEALYQRARFVERFKNDLKHAAELAGRSIAAKPHWRAFLFRAKLEIKAAEYKDAAMSLDAALKLEPSAREALLVRGRLRTKLGDASGAAADFEKALAVAEASVLESVKAACHVSGGETYVRFPQALEVPAECERQDLAIIGIEGFLLQNGGLAPQMDLIADYSDQDFMAWELGRKACNRAAADFLKSWNSRPGLAANFVFREKSA